MATTPPVQEGSAPDFATCLEAARATLGDAASSADLDAANRLINRALTLRPSDASAWLVKCQLASAMSDEVAALAAVEMAARRAPRRAEVHYWRGAVLGDLGRYRPALRAFERAFRHLLPDEQWLLEDLYYEKALVLEAMGHRDAATATYRAGLVRCPSSALLREGLRPPGPPVLRVLRGGQP
ncbi:MAG: hypothetical protein KBG28_20685 [Kofleriaceae bacterium]|jgi:tetratricopeptide (TPR) repeat protein|nr:hypothetical protein [Kofleriaceae bacterium]MBP6836530.1 hypothetical protein [Kofleriaceae bacterium]MBP9206402.1 hypothetical protein [Kofleriaceae bacterium]